MRKYIFLLALCLSLTGCARLFPKPPAEYTVTFQFQDIVLETQTVIEGELPSEPAVPVFPGLRFLGWDAPLTAVQEDCFYEARFAPVLDRHVRYLFPDSSGMLHPDDPFTGSDLQEALSVLAADGAEAFFPELPDQDTAVSAEMLQQLLEVFYPDAAPGLWDTAHTADALTRADAAQILNRYLGRSSETVAPAPDALGFPDVSPNREDWADLMEAAVMHTDGNAPWTELQLTTGKEPGWELQDGRLRRYDENGYLILNDIVDSAFQMDAEGFYTSGSKALDGYVEAMLAGFQKDNPEADRDGLLRMAFDHTRDSYKYLRRRAYDFGQTGWEMEDALTMFETGKGNCYNYAAVFWALARGLGYDMHTVCGTIGGHPHGWCKIVIDDTEYYCDPEIEMTLRKDYQVNADMFMLKRGLSRMWEYAEPPQKGE